MANPPDDHRNAAGRTPLEHDRRIINGSMLALVAFAIVAIGIVWFALTEGRSRIAAFKHQTIERPVPDGTTGYGGARPKAPAPNPAAKE